MRIVCVIVTQDRPVEQGKKSQYPNRSEQDKRVRLLRWQQFTIE